MRTISLCFALVISAVLCASAGAMRADAEVAKNPAPVAGQQNPMGAVAQEGGNKLSEPYKNQGAFQCNGRALKIPSYFPHTDKKNEGLFIVGDKDCDPENFKVVLGLTPDCDGQNFCLSGSFSSTSVAKNYPADALYKALSLHAEKKEIGGGVSGYLVPSQCFAYCNETQLVWFDKGRVFVIGTKFSKKETPDELIKAANSYISEGR